jgi:cytochrome c-type biogenesis protein CcmH
MLVLSLAVLLAAVVLFIVFPLFRRTPKPLPLGNEASRGEERSDLEIEKQNVLTSLRDLESDFAGGKISAADFERLKTFDEHRLADLLAKMDQQNPEDGETGERGRYSEEFIRKFRKWNLAGSVVLVVLVAGSASGIYYQKYLQQEEQREEAMGGPMMGGAPNPLEMVARLERKLRENPNDLVGQLRAGRSYMTLQRYEDARKTWTKVLELDPVNTEAYYNLGILQIQTIDPGNLRNFEEAIQYFDKALETTPGMPAALFYRGVALVHLKRYDEAEQSWVGALQGLPPGSEDSEFVKEEIRKLKAGNPLS